MKQFLLKLRRFVSAAALLYGQDWALGWLIGLIVLFAIGGGVIVTICAWLFVMGCVYLFQVKVTKTFVDQVWLPEDQRTKFGVAVVGMQTGLLAPVHGIRSFRARMTEKWRGPRSNTQKSHFRWLTFVVGSWAAGGFLFMTYRYVRDGMLESRFWRKVRIAGFIFAVRFSSTYVLLPSLVKSVR